ncbi:MAG: hypothetical protein H0U54_14825 [Acidobacteria bacterium]|nr:hypothetical protein [Acidobacteriota bacterium]
MNNPANIVFGTPLSSTQLNATASVQRTFTYNPGTWITGLTNGTMTRGQVLRALIESSKLYQKFYNEAFVILQYFGYLRRDADSLYLQWIQTLNQKGDYRTMINGFLNSTEYRRRFGQ